MSKGAASDIARQTHELHGRADELFTCDVIQQAVGYLSKLSQPQLTFMESVISSGNMVGKLLLNLSQAGTLLSFYRAGKLYARLTPTVRPVSCNWCDNRIYAIVF